MAEQSNEELKLLFALYDVDNSGSLTRDELKELLKSPDPSVPELSEEKLTEYLKLADTDGSGDISVDEFVLFMNNNVTKQAYGLNSIFRTIDKNGDGSIEKAEFDEAKANNNNLNVNLVKILDKTFALDGQTKVTLAEFIQSVKDYFGNGGNQ